MTRPSVAAALAEQARLYGKALRLTEEFCARVRGGDESGGEAFSRVREAIFQRISAMGAAPEPVPGDAGGIEAFWRQSTTAIERIMELDRELLILLEARKAQVGRELAEIGQGRRMLASYRGPSAISPAFLDRVS
jgi:uncharacterized protein (DUF2236 family)